jgi:ABC-type branched-subunit amino acid transport system substrate-binding protein
VALGSGKANAAQIARAIVAKRPQAVLNHGSYSTYAEIYREVRALDPTIQFYAVNSGAQQMVRQLGASAEGIVFTQVVPFPWGAVQPVVREYQLAMRRHAPKDELSFSSLEGFINAKLLVAALRRVAGQPNPESLVRALEESGDIDLGGFRVRYASADRAGSSFVDTVFTRKDGRFRAR